MVRKIEMNQLTLRKRTASDLKIKSRITKANTDIQKIETLSHADLRSSVRQSKISFTWKLSDFSPSDPKTTNFLFSALQLSTKDINCL